MIVKKTTSPIWHFFIKHGHTAYEAQCSICLKIVKTGGGTTNLRQHLKNQHHDHFLSLSTSLKLNGGKGKKKTTNTKSNTNPPLPVEKGENETGPDPEASWFLSSSSASATSSLTTITITPSSSSSPSTSTSCINLDPAPADSGSGSASDAWDRDRDTLSAPASQFPSLPQSSTPATLTPTQTQHQQRLPNIFSFLSSPCSSSSALAAAGARTTATDTNAAEPAVVIRSRSRSSTPTSACASSPASPSCSMMNMKQLTLFQNHERTSSYERGGKRATELTNALIFMVCRDNLPHSLVEKDGFAYFTKTAVPLYKLPSRKTVTEMVSRKYCAALQIIRNLLHNVAHLSLSADICTVTNTSKGFLVLTAHFISPKNHEIKNQLETIMLGVCRLRENHTADYICEKLQQMLELFDVPTSKIVGFCTDGGANMIAGVRRLLGDGKNIYCFAHLLNLIVMDGLSDEKNPILINLVNDVKSIVKFGRQSNVFMEMLRKEQEREGEGTSEGNVMLLIQSVPTRWNSTYHMLQRFVKLSPFIARVLANPNIKNAPRMISGNDIELITEITQILMPFDAATKEISGTEYVTGSLVIPLVSCIETQLINVNKNNQHNASKILADKLLASLEERSPKAIHNPLLCHATLADPRFKRIYMNPNVASQAVQTFSREIKTYLAEIGKSSPSLDCRHGKEGGPTNNIQTPTNRIWLHHDENIVTKFGSADPTERSEFPSELKLYLQQPLLPRSSDPFQFWRQGQSCMPGLSFVGLKYLCCVGSSVASERLVSSLNDVVSDERSRLTDQHITERVFLHKLGERYWTHLVG